MEAQPAKRFWGSYGLVEARKVKWGVFPVWAFGEVHDPKFFWLDTQANVHESFFKDGVGILEPGYVNGKGGGGGEEDTLDEVG